MTLSGRRIFDRTPGTELLYALVVEDGAATCVGAFATRAEAEAAAEAAGYEYAHVDEVEVPVSGHRAQEWVRHAMHRAWGAGYWFGRGQPDDSHNEDVDRMVEDVESLLAKVEADG